MDFNSLFPLRFYLNLGRRDDRRAEVQREFLVAGITAERFPAIDYRWTKESRGFQSRQYRACALSHRLAIREAKKRKAPAVLIFEDDVVLSPDFLAKVASIELPDDWGLLYFGCAHVEKPGLVSPGLVRVAGALDCHAYAIRADCYDLALSATASCPKGLSESREAYDALLCKGLGEVPAYALFPNLAWQAVGESDNLGTFYSHYDTSGNQKYLTELLEGIQAPSLGISPSKHRSKKTEVSSPPPPSYPHPHIAFLFLTRENLNQPNVWEEYLEGYEDQYEIFVHSKYPDRVTQEFLKTNIICDTAATAWGHISLVQATLRLLRAALQNSENTHFVLCSESCLPIKPFAKLRRLLQLDGRSWISHAPPSAYDETNPPKAVRFQSILGFPTNCAFLQQQWMMLDRTAAEDLLADDMTEAFANMFAPDEAYFISLLRLKGYPTHWVKNEKPTWSEWIDENRHPTTFEEMSPDLLGSLFSSCSYFARKFPPEIDLSSFSLHRDDH